MGIAATAKKLVLGTPLTSLHGFDPQAGL